MAAADADVLPDESRDTDPVDHLYPLTGSGLEGVTQEITYSSEDEVFESSSEQSPKRIGYAPADQDRLLERIGRGFRINGATPADAFLDLGAPLDERHMSGWGYRGGAVAIGGTAINDSVADYKEAIADRMNADGQVDGVTVGVSLPLLAMSIGEELEDEYGNLDDLFPDMRLLLTNGDTMNPYLRESLEDLWGATVKETWAATECGIGAAEYDTPGQLVPLYDDLIFEIIPEEHAFDEHGTPIPVDRDDIYPLAEVPDQTVGSLVISDPDRQTLPFEEATDHGSLIARYRVGDLFKVHQGAITQIEFMDREDDQASLGGAPVYEKQIDTALRNAYGGVREWRGVVYSTDRIYPSMDVFAVGDQPMDASSFIDELYRQNTAFKHAHAEAGTVDDITVTPADSMDAIEDYINSRYDVEEDLFNPRKATRIGTDASYR